MDRSTKFLTVYVFCAVVIVAYVGISFYYPSYTEQITVKKLVSGERQWGIVTTEGNYYNINFETYATVEEGKSYIGVVTQPVFTSKFINHLKPISSFPSWDDFKSEE